MSNKNKRSNTACYPDPVDLLPERSQTLVNDELGELNFLLGFQEFTTSMSANRRYIYQSCSDFEKARRSLKTCREAEYSCKMASSSALGTSREQTTSISLSTSILSPHPAHLNAEYPHLQSSFSSTNHCSLAISRPMRPISSTPNSHRPTLGMLHLSQSHWFTILEVLEATEQASCGMLETAAAKLSVCNDTSSESEAGETVQMWHNLIGSEKQRQDTSSMISQPSQSQGLTLKLPPDKVSAAVIVCSLGRGGVGRCWRILGARTTSAG